MTNKVLLFICIGMSFFCKEKANGITAQTEENPWCKKIDTLITEFYGKKTGNFYANRIIPQLISESKIDAGCEKGYTGYRYREDDSLFNADIKRWKEYFKCK